MQLILLITLGFFLLFILFYVIHSCFLVYHLLRFSVRRDRAVMFATIFAGISLVLLVLALSLLFRVSWNAPLLTPVGTSSFSRIL